MIDRLSEQLERILHPIKVRIANSIARAVVQLVDDGKKLQMMQVGVLEGEDVDDVEHFQQYGFSSVPLAGAEAVVLFPNGDRAHPLLVAVDDRRHRPTGASAGEVVLYTDEGEAIRLGRGQVVTIVGTSVELGASPLTPADGVLTGQALDPFTGKTHFILGNASTRVKASKT